MKNKTRVMILRIVNIIPWVLLALTIGMLVAVLLSLPSSVHAAGDPTGGMGALSHKMIRKTDVQVTADEFPSSFGVLRTDSQSSPTRGEDVNAWTMTDTALQTTFIVATAMDWSQTLELSRICDRPRFYDRKTQAAIDGPCDHEEVNPLLGHKPSKGKINALMPAGIIMHTAIAYLLPRPYRTIWQSFWIGAETDTVQANRRAGLGISLHF